MSPQQPKLVLLRGGIAQIAGLSGEMQLPTRNLHVMASSQEMIERSCLYRRTIKYSPFELYWKENQDGRRVSRRIPAGTTYLRAVYLPKDGLPQFSEITYFKAKSEQVHKETLRVKPGIRLQGELDRSVPRPVRAGIVYAIVPPVVGGRASRWDWHGYSPPQDAALLHWHTSTKIKADGTFVFRSLPPSPHVKLLAICDGFISQSPPNQKQDAEPYIAPDAYILDGRSLAIIKMERTGQCEVRLTDNRGRPLRRANVSVDLRFYQPETFPILFPQLPLPDSRDRLQDGDNTFWRKHFGIFFKDQRRLDREEAEARGFAAQTDERGIALLSNIPAGEHRLQINTYRRRAGMGITNYFTLKKVDEGSDVKITPGQTTRIKHIVYGD